MSKLRAVSRHYIRPIGALVACHCRNHIDDQSAPTKPQRAVRLAGVRVIELAETVLLNQLPGARRDVLRLVAVAVLEQSADEEPVLADPGRPAPEP